MEEHDQAEAGNGGKRDAVVQAKVDEKLEEELADFEARLDEYKKLDDQKKLAQPPPISFDPNQVAFTVKAAYVREACRTARIAARKRILGYRPQETCKAEDEEELLEGDGLVRELEVRIKRHGFFGHTHAVTGVKFAPNGQIMATTSADGTIKIWSTKTGLLIRTMAGHQGAVQAADWAADSRALVTCGVDKTIRIWDTFIGEVIQVVRGHTDTISSVQFDKDSQWVLSSSTDHTLRLWRVVPQLPDPPAAVRFSSVSVDVVRHVVDVDLRWLAPLSFGGPIIQYLILRRRVRKGKEESDEFNWGKLVAITALNSTEAALLHKRQDAYQQAHSTKIPGMASLVDMDSRSKLHNRVVKSVRKKANDDRKTAIYNAATEKLKKGEDEPPRMPPGMEIQKVKPLVVGDVIEQLDPVAGMDLEGAADGNTNDKRGAAPPTKCRIHDLLPGRTYQFVIAAESPLGIGVFSAPVQQFIPAATPRPCEQPKVQQLTVLALS